MKKVLEILGVIWILECVYMAGEKAGQKIKNNDRGKSYLGYSAYRKNKDDVVIFNSRNDAAEVAGFLIDLLSDYGQVSVSDFYEAAGITPTYGMAKMGWTDMRDISICRAQGGYFINLPKPKILN